MDRIWQCGRFSFHWQDRTLVMGIVNVTPDSFSDGGDYFDPVRAIEHAYRLFDEGADMVDVGGESSRPGAEPVPVEEELRRVVPVIEEIAGKSGLPVSIDTVKYDVASRAVEAGAAVINDISGLQNDPRLAQLAGESGAGLVIMHMRGTPRTMQSMTEYRDVASEVYEFFMNQRGAAKAGGVADSQLCFDPGIGFGKTAGQNLDLIRRLRDCKPSGFPLLLGVSRKSFIGKVTGADDANDRLAGSLAAALCGVRRGVDILRVHDVRATRDALAVAGAIERGELEQNIYPQH